MKAFSRIGLKIRLSLAGTTSRNSLQIYCRGGAARKNLGVAGVHLPAAVPFHDVDIGVDVGAGPDLVIFQVLGETLAEAGVPRVELCEGDDVQLE